MKILIILFVLAASLHSWVYADALAKPDEKKFDSSAVIEEQRSEIKGQVTIAGQPIKYTATSGNLVLRDDKQKQQASIFYVAYVREGIEDNSKRPITFCFNGGPGSSSVWLHIGAFGPRKVRLTEEGYALPPYQMEDNPYSILDVTDLVFIDPVSTGFSRAAPDVDPKQFHGVQEDIKSVAEFIRLYLTREERWDSPKYLCGESYGTTRAAGLGGYLHDEYNVYTNGIILVSSILDFQTLMWGSGNDLPFVLFLPSYTASAWYHKKLASDLQESLPKALKEAEEFALNDYATALMKGDKLDAQARAKIVEKLARLTGLAPQYIEREQLRVSAKKFMTELLKSENRIIGRFDGRYKGMDFDCCAYKAILELDPSYQAVAGAYTAAFNQYLQKELKWKRDDPYNILVFLESWNYSLATNQYLYVGDVLKGVISKNPILKVYVANGYYDLATPYFATEYTFGHLGLDPSLRGNVRMGYYEGGHMLYNQMPALIQLRKELLDFYKW